MFFLDSDFLTNVPYNDLVPRFYQSLGSRITRNDKTPAYITEFHLSPVVAKVLLN